MAITIEQIQELADIIVEYDDAVERFYNEASDKASGQMGLECATSLAIALYDIAYEQLEEWFSSRGESNSSDIAWIDIDTLLGTVRYLAKKRYVLDNILGGLGYSVSQGLDSSGYAHYDEWYKLNFDDLVATPYTERYAHDTLRIDMGIARHKIMKDYIDPIVERMEKVKNLIRKF